MKKLILAAAALLLSAFAAPAFASNCSPLPYTLSNGTTADATQVMADLNLLLGCANTSLAHNGANADITSLSTLSTPLSASQGGTGVTSLTALYQALAIPFDFYVFQGGQTGNGWILAAYQPSSAVILASGSSRCTYGTAATSSAAYTLTDNGTTIATVTFTSSGCSVSFNSSPYTVTAGHLLKLAGPATADTTLADIGMTFGGTRD